MTFPLRLRISAAHAKRGPVADFGELGVEYSRNWLAKEWGKIASVVLAAKEGTVGGRSLVPFTYQISVSGITTTVICHGSLVSENIDELKQLIKPMIPKCRHIVLDLSDVSFVDSAGLGALVGLKVSAASAAYCSLEFINFSPLVKELLNTTKLNQLLGSS